MFQKRIYPLIKIYSKVQEILDAGNEDIMTIKKILTSKKNTFIFGKIFFLVNSDKVYKNGYWVLGLEIKIIYN